MSDQINVVFVLTDQLKASSLPIFGEDQVETPHLDQLAADGVTLTNSIASCPMCTPSRAMLLTGRHPQTTGHIINSTRTRHTELSIADAFARRGYRTGWVGKWHLHTGVWPAIEYSPRHPDWVPEGRDRLGFQYWKAYNQHMVFFDGFVHGEDWRYEQWEGYETHGLLDYGIQFMDSVGDDPFLLFLSPHQPHYTPFEYAPKHYYECLPTELTLPDNVPQEVMKSSLTMYRHYLAMILAIDDMLGDLMAYLTQTGKVHNTLIIFTSDHGTQAGAHGIDPWQKKHPYEESIHVPTILRLPGVLEGGLRNDTLTTMVDFFPTLSALCSLPVPRSVEGFDLSRAWLGEANAPEEAAVLTMNFSSEYDWFADGMEWRGVRTKTHSYARWLNGRVELYDISIDPLQMNNLATDPEYQDLRDEMEATMQGLMETRCDELVPCTTWKHWLDNQRRVIRNAYGPLGDPEGEPDWSLLY